MESSLKDTATELVLAPVTLPPYLYLRSITYTVMISQITAFATIKSIILQMQFIDQPIWYICIYVYISVGLWTSLVSH